MKDYKVNKLFEIGEVFLEMTVDFVKVYFRIFVDEDIPEASYGRKVNGKVTGQNPCFPQDLYRLPVFLGFPQPPLRDDDLGDIDNTLGSQVKISLHRSPHKRVFFQVIGGVLPALTEILHVLPQSLDFMCYFFLYRHTPTGPFAACSRIIAALLLS